MTVFLNEGRDNAIIRPDAGRGETLLWGLFAVMSSFWGRTPTALLAPVGRG